MKLLTAFVKAGTAIIKANLLFTSIIPRKVILFFYGVLVTSLDSCTSVVRNLEAGMPHSHGFYVIK